MWSGGAGWWPWIEQWSGPWVGASVLAFVVALLGGWLARRDDRWTGAVAAVAVLAGWMLTAPRPGGWWAPRAVAESLVVPAAAMLLAGVLGVRTRGRVRGWLVTAATWFGAWWLAGVPAARGEFWRVLFATVAVTWVLRLMRAGQAGRAVAVALVLLGAMLAAGGPPGVAAVLVGAAAGLAVLGPATPFSPALLAFGLVGSDLMAGRATMGRVGLVDIACVLAVLAPAAVGPAAAGVQRLFGRKLGRRLERVVGVAATLLVAGVAVGLAWALMRVLR